MNQKGVPMAIEDLLAVVRPPTRRVEVGKPSQVPAIEEHLMLSLPRDYIDFGLHYGSGVFFDRGGVSITAINPFSKRYMEGVRLNAEFLREMKQMVEREVPFG